MQTIYLTSGDLIASCTIQDTRLEYSYVHAEDYSYSYKPYIAI